MTPGKAIRLGFHSDPIPPHRAWLSVQGKGELDGEEHGHILRCVHCLRLFLLCLESETFGAVLKELDDTAA
jgi:hypothetical protein